MAVENVEIWVSGGSGSTAPYYQFYADSNGSQALDEVSLDSSCSYTFRRLGGATSHPFYLSDVGYKQGSTDAISINGDGDPSQGIIGEQVLTISFNEEAAAVDTLIYYCTLHSIMQGNFRVFDDSISDDFSADTSTIGLITNLDGSLVNGSLEASGDQDWFRVALAANTSYTIDLQGADTSQGTLSDPLIIGIFDALGTPIANTSDDDGGISLNSQLTFTPTAAGDYFIAAGSYGDSLDGSYAISVSTGSTGAPGPSNPTDDFSADTSTIGLITNLDGSLVNGSLEASGDQDWFRVALAANTSYTIDLQGADTSQGTLSDPLIIGIFDALGTPIANTSDDDGGISLNSQLTFTPTAAGDYFIAAGSYGDSLDGSYAISVSTGSTGAPGPSNPTDDFSADTSTIGLITNLDGSLVNGSLEASGDQDWFRVALAANTSYTIDLQGADTSQGTLSDPLIIGIFDALGTPIANTSDDDGGISLNSQLTFTPTAAGDYFIAAGSYGDSLDGSYAISVSTGSTGAPGPSNPTDDFSADTSTIGLITNLDGSLVNGSLEASGDQDWFRVALAANTSYTIDLQGADTSQGTLSDPLIIGIFDALGTPIANTSDDDGGISLNSQLTFTPTAAGDYFIAAGSYGDSLDGSYAISVSTGSTGAPGPSNPTDDFSADTSTIGLITNLDGSLVNGSLEASGDQDWFRVALAANTSYTIDLQGADTSQGTLSDPLIIGIFDALGTSIANTSDDDGGISLNSQLTFTPTAAGDYFIAAGSYGDSLDGSYAISVSTGSTGAPGPSNPADDFSADTSTIGLITNLDGSLVNGSLEASGDQDWFRVALAANTSYTIDLQGADTSQGTLSDPLIIGIFDALGTPIANTSDDDGGISLNSQLTFTPTAAGDYFIAAGSFGDSLDGSYAISVSTGSTGAPGPSNPTDDFSADTSTIGLITNLDGSLVNGSLEASGDQDWFRVALAANTSYTIDLQGADTSQGTLSDPLIIGIFDALGTPIANTSDDDGGISLNSQLTFTPTAAGDYFIAAGSYGDSLDGSYAISVSTGSTGAPGPSNPTDDFSADTSTIGLITNLDGSLVNGSLEASGDQDWFRVALAANTSYTIDLQGADTSQGTLSDPLIIGIFDALGTPIANTSDDDGGISLNSQLTFTPTAAGDYFIAAGSYGDSLDGSYAISVHETEANIPSDDFSADINTSGVVRIGSISTGAVENSGDLDWFNVSLTAGDTYRIQVVSAANSNTPLADPLLAGVYDSAGLLIPNTTNRDGGDGNNSEITLTIDSTDNYFISAGSEFNTTGDYKVHVERLEIAISDDYSNSPETTGTLAINGSTTGSIETSFDEDWMQTSLVEGNTYQIDLQGASTDKGTLRDPYLVGIYDANGSLIQNTTDDNSGELLNSSINFEAPVNGTYYIAAKSADDLTGSYKLSLVDITEVGQNDDYGQTTDSAGLITLNDPKGASIEIAGDHDWFKVSLRSGQRYTITQKGADSGSGSLTDPLIYGIYTSSGDRIDGTRVDDGGTGSDASLSFMPTVDGDYFIAASAYQSNTGDYTLEIQKFNDPSESSETFDITLNFEGDAQYRPAFDRAVAIWESIITEDLPDASLENYGAVDDLVIDASVVYIDGPGQTLGQAGPRWIRTDSKLPIQGVMHFDSADIDYMIGKGTFEEVILHEMGHILGIGTLWSYLGLIDDERTQYFGSNAVRELNKILDTTQNTSVPLETGGGAGTRGSHWSEEIFIDELMTGYLSGDEQPLSKITIGSLHDMGYKVNYSPADNFTLDQIAWDWSIASQGQESALNASNFSGNSNIIGNISNLNDSNLYSDKEQLLLRNSTKPMEIINSSEGTRLRGRVTDSSETSITIGLEGRPNEFVEFIGEFEKNTPQTQEDIYGLVSSVNFYQSYVLLKTINFPGLGHNAASLINNWRDIELSGNNFIEIDNLQSYDDIIHSGDGDDAIFGSGGNDELDGGSGIDIAIYRGHRKDYRLIQMPISNVIQVIDAQMDRDGFDELTNIEILSFAGESIAVDSLMLEQAAVHYVSARPSSIVYSVNTSIDFSLDYASSDDEQSTGLAFRMHYDSELLSLDIEEGITERYEGLDTLEFVLGSDDLDLDGNPQTDSYIDIRLESSEGGLPSSLKIADFSFQLQGSLHASGLTESIIGFTSISTSPGYDFSADSLYLVPNNAPTGAPTLSGNFKVGQTISIDALDIEDADNFEGWTPTYEYSWEVSGDNGISWTELTSSDATDGDDSYTLTSAEVGKQLRGVVSYLDGYGTNEVVKSITSPSIESGVEVSVFGHSNVGQYLDLEVEFTDGEALPIRWLGWQAKAPESAIGIKASDITYEFDDGDGVIRFFYKEEGLIGQYVHEDEDLEEGVIDLQLNGFRYPLYVDLEPSDEDYNVGFVDDFDVDDYMPLRYGHSSLIVFEENFPYGEDSQYAFFVPKQHVEDLGLGSFEHAPEIDLSLYDEHFFDVPSSDIAIDDSLYLSEELMGFEVRACAALELENGRFELVYSEPVVIDGPLPFDAVYPVHEGELMNHSPEGELLVAGKVEIGKTISLDASSITDADGIDSEFDYDWQVFDGDTDTWFDRINPDATDGDASYTLTNDDEGELLRAQVSYVDGNGLTEIISSDSFIVGTPFPDAGSYQSVVTRSADIGYRPGGSIRLPLIYNVSTDDANLSGLTLNVHYDSTLLAPEGADYGVSGMIDAVISTTADLPDVDDLDNDPMTDRMVQLVWSSFDNSFPDQNLPHHIANVSFESLEDLSVLVDSLTGSRINFTASETAAGYDFLPSSTTLTPRDFDLDVDGDGAVTALGDGLMIIRKLFGPAFSGDKLTNKAISPAATRTTEEIHDFIQDGIVAGDLDVDQDGNTTALGDGLMVIRHLFGAAFSGGALTSKALSPDSPYAADERPWEAVAENIDGLYF